MRPINERYEARDYGFYARSCAPNPDSSAATIRERSSAASSSESVRSADWNAARKAGFQPSDTPCLLVEGDDRKGLGAEISRALANAGINMGFLVAETIGGKFSAAIGLATGQDATAAAKAIESIRPAPAKAKGKK